MFLAIFCVVVLVVVRLLREFDISTLLELANLLLLLVLLSLYDVDKIIALAKKKFHHCCRQTYNSGTFMETRFSEVISHLHDSSFNDFVNTTGNRLVDYSPSDKPWDTHRANTDAVSAIYSQVQEFERLAVRMNQCSGFLDFRWLAESSTGEAKLRLHRAFFCRVRFCPVCQWRRSLMWQARFLEALPKVVAEYPKARWIFLTLTVRNCEIGQLGDTLKHMNLAWNKFIKREDLKAIDGWIRSTEVTRSSQGEAHPHFHCLMMVKPSFFTHSYVKQSRFADLWQESLKSNYTPLVDVRTIKPKKGQDLSNSSVDFLRGAVAETLKYSVKSSDLKSDDKWFLELTRQTFKKRFIATGGVLKNVLRLEDETNQDLILGDNDGSSDDLGSVRFGWQSTVKHYKKI